MKGNDIDAVAALVNAVFTKMKFGAPVTVEGDKAVLRQAYYCPIMVSSISLKVPWGWLDENFAWPWLKGVASVVNPNIEFTVKMARSRGDPICEHVFEIK